jgi:hypothetical protein
MGDWLRTRYRPRARKLIAPFVLAVAMIALAVAVGRCSTS